MRDWLTCSLTEIFGVRVKIPPSWQVALVYHIWGQSKNTSELAGGAGLLLSIFTLTPNIPKYPQISG